MNYTDRKFSAIIPTKSLFELGWIDRTSRKSFEISYAYDTETNEITLTKEDVEPIGAFLSEQRRKEYENRNKNRKAMKEDRLARINKNNESAIVGFKKLVRIMTEHRDEPLHVNVKQQIQEEVKLLQKDLRNLINKERKTGNDRRQIKLLKRLIKAFGETSENY